MDAGQMPIESNGISEDWDLGFEAGIKEGLSMRHPASEGETVGSIIRKWLEVNGYDGLCQEDCECGCKLDDLAPCESSDFINCIPGHITKGKDGYDFFVKPGKATRPTPACEICGDTGRYYDLSATDSEIICDCGAGTAPKEGE